MDKAIYHAGKRHDIDGDISDAFDDARRDRDDCFLWIGLHEPTREEFALIEEELSLHPLAVEGALTAHQRPKLEHYDETLFVVLKTLAYHEETSDVEVGEAMLFIGTDFVVSVRHGTANPLARVRRRLEADPALLALLGKQQNEEVRKISAWAAVIAIPTMIAGFYGMNFDHMPELHWLFGYPAIMGVMVAASGLAYYRLRKNGWL